MRPRPTRYDEAICNAAAIPIAERVREWALDGGADADAANIDLITRDVAEAIRYRDDGYAIAKLLDDYSPDAELVAILDRASMELDSALRTACKAWVIDTGIVAPAIESRVTAVTQPQYGVGIVTHNYADGRAVVLFESLGHVRSGVGSHGLVIEWERLIPGESEATNENTLDPA